MEFGYRGLRVGGDLNKYRSDLNYKAGPRVFDSSFLMRARDMVPLSEVFLIPMGGMGSQRLRVIYGAFDNAKQAQEAERHLPPKYQQAFRTSARTFGELRKQM